MKDPLNTPVGFTACWKKSKKGRCRMPKGHSGKHGYVPEPKEEQPISVELDGSVYLVEVVKGKEVRTRLSDEVVLLMLKDGIEKALKLMINTLKKEKE